MKIIALIQARMGSQRLPNKALLKIYGKTAIEWIALRLKDCRSLDGIALSTTDQAKDDVLEALARRIPINFYRGSEVDLIQRHLGAARKFGADAVVRITADCPLVDPALLDRMIELYRARKDDVDMVTNNFPPTHPHGLDMEIIPRVTLERLDAEVNDPKYREWLTTFILNNPANFRILNVPCTENLSHHRWTLDYPEDLAFLRKIYRLMAAAGGRFSTQQVLDLLAGKPEVFKLNRNRVDVSTKHGVRLSAQQAVMAAKVDSSGE